MKIAHLVFASTLVGSCNAWAELEILQAGIQMAPAEKPADRKVGTVWRALKDGSPYSTTLIKDTGSSDTNEDSEGCSWTKPKGFYSPSTEWKNCNGSDGTALVSLSGEIFPLQVGKEWSYDVDGDNWRTTRNCIVEDTARVKTGIGEHDTFKIVCTDKWNTRTRYYSPKLQTSVFLDRNRRTKAQHIRYEFIKFD